MLKCRITTGHNDSEQGYSHRSTFGRWRINIDYYEAWGRVEHPTDDEIEELLSELRQSLKQEVSRG